MEYEHEQFDHGHELIYFLNKNNIKKENIVSIYTSRYYHHLVYIKQ